MTIKISKIMKRTQAVYSVDYSTDDIFAICTNSDILFMTTKEFSQIGEIPGGPFLHAVVFNHTIAAVSASDSPPYTPFFLLLYNLKNKTCIKSIEFPSRILDIKATKTMLIISLESRIMVYATSNFKILYTINRHNKSGLINAKDNFFVSVEDQIPGKVFINSLTNFSTINTINAHDSPIQAIAISDNGKEIVTASEKGTIIRIFDISTGKKLREFRRGYTQNRVRCIAANEEAVVVCTARTIHAFTSHGHIYGNIFSTPVYVKLNDKLILIISDDGQIMFFKIDISDWKIINLNQSSIFRSRYFQ